MIEHNLFTLAYKFALYFWYSVFQSCKIMNPDLLIETNVYLFHCDLIVCPLPPREKKKVVLKSHYWPTIYYTNFRVEVIYLFLLTLLMLATLLIHQELFHFGLTLCTVLYLQKVHGMDPFKYFSKFLAFWSRWNFCLKLRVRYLSI